VNIDFPYHIDGRGRTAETERDDHIRDLIAQVLFTTPGERVNRPDFGTGLMRLVFEPSSTELAATIQTLVRGALQQWLAEVIRVDDVLAESQEGRLTIDVRYTVVVTRETGVATFTRPV
jgi:phage baseplate assembly protein W